MRAKQIHVMVEFDMYLYFPAANFALLHKHQKHPQTTHTYNEYKMSPTSISGGGNLLTGGELISPASCDAKLVPVGKGQEEVLPSAKLEQWPYNMCG